MLFAAAMAVSVAAGAFSAYQQHQAGKAADKIGKFNAKVGAQQATDALDRGLTDEKNYRIAGRGLIGSQRAGLAAQNVTLDDGTALDIQADTARQIEMDALTIRNNAAREAWGFKVGAVDAGNRGSIARTEGKMAGFSTVLNTGANALSMGYSGYGSRKPATGKP